MMPPCGTFQYVLTVPERIGYEGFECGADVREPIPTTGEPHIVERLVGYAPRVRVSEAGFTPDASPTRPWVMRSQITLTAPTRERASVREASFHVDKALTSVMKLGDEVHLSRTEHGGLGLSVLRAGELVVAVGAITAVPLGVTIQASVPSDLIQEALAMCRRGDPAFEFLDVPVEVAISGVSSILNMGERKVGAYTVHMGHGYRIAITLNESGAIVHDALCPKTPAVASALLMDWSDALSMGSW